MKLMFFDGLLHLEIALNNKQRQIQVLKKLLILLSVFTLQNGNAFVVFDEELKSCTCRHKKKKNPKDADTVLKDIGGRGKG